ncbi:hypothetical protein GIB67_013878 [Kingdonia uniflora]|uniref:Uncharacterized protein n=1 Tax=Kingdonia uniflora TaxID=39325 RepID=A0A7J7LD88_9MAGN|nr:hypothetical protein GIB67_013878 [Kingdonia uniflora]
MILPISEGMVPLNVFLLKFMDSSLEKFPNNLGIGPLRLLDDTSRCASLDRLPTSEGNKPESSFRLRVLRLWGCIMRDCDRVGKNYLVMIASSSGQLVHQVKVLIPPTATEIYIKIVEKTQVFQFLTKLNPNFEYARVHLLDRTPFLTLEEAHAYCLSDQSRRSPMPFISGIPSKTSAMAIRYAYPVPP